MPRRLRITWLALVATLAVPRPATAAPAGSMFSGPTSPDAAVIFWNPAGMTMMRGTHTLTMGTFLLFRAEYHRDTPSAFDDKMYPVATSVTPAALPSAGVVTDFGTRNWRFGLGFALSNADGVDWSEEYEGKPGSTRHHAIVGRWITFLIEPAVAYRFSRYLSVGIGLDVHGMWVFRSAKFDFGAKINQLICAESELPTCPLDSPLAREDPAFDVHYEIDGYGAGLGFFAGVLITPFPWLRMGLTVHSGAGTMQVPVDLILRYPKTVTDYMKANLSAVALPPIEASIDVARHAPIIILAGAAINPTPKLELAADFLWMQTSTDPIEQNTVLFTNNTLISDQMTFNVKKDHYQWGARGTYRVLEQLVAGVRIEVRPIKIPELYAMPVSVDFDRLSVHVGATWRVTRWMTLLLEYAHHFTFTRTVSKSLFAPNAYPTTPDEQAFDKPSPTGTYKVSTDHLAIGVLLHL